MSSLFKKGDVVQYGSGREYLNIPNPPMIVLESFMSDNGNVECKLLEGDRKIWVREAWICLVHNTGHP